MIQDNNEKYERQREIRNREFELYSSIEEGLPQPVLVDQQVWLFLFEVPSLEEFENVAGILIQNINNLNSRYSEENSLVFDYDLEHPQKSIFNFSAELRIGVIRINVSDINEMEMHNLAEDIFQSIPESLDSELPENNSLIDISAAHIAFGRALQSGQWGGGGPGGWPFIPFWHIPDTGMDDENAPYAFKLPDPDPAFPDQDYVTKLKIARGAGVVVAILDAAPASGVWQQLATTFAATNPLIKSMLNKLTLVQPSSLSPTEEGIINKSNMPSYNMVDHGIFVAGIIHSIAPDAEIILYRTLADEGTTYNNPFQDVLEDIAEIQGDDRPLIINCSLNLTIRDAEEHRADKSLSEIVFAISKELITAPRKNGLVVAASGNHGTYKDLPLPLERPINPPQADPSIPVLDTYHFSSTVSDAPPYPRFPAAFEGSLGVSALDKQGERTKYTNWADDFDLPEELKYSGNENMPRRGIATYGGDIVEIPDPDPAASGDRFYNMRLASPFDSILGAYISDFQIPVPEYKGDSYPHETIENKQGWALWSGTSFATAIVSGVLALMASHELIREANGEANIATNDGLIQKLLDYCGPARITHTDDNGNPIEAEHVLNVTQNGFNIQ